MTQNLRHLLEIVKRVILQLLREVFLDQLQSSVIVQQFTIEQLYQLQSMTMFINHNNVNIKKDDIGHDL